MPRADVEVDNEPEKAADLENLIEGLAACAGEEEAPSHAHGHEVLVVVRRRPQDPAEESQDLHEAVEDMRVVEVRNRLVPSGLDDRPHRNLCEDVQVRRTLKDVEHLLAHEVADHDNLDVYSHSVTRAVEPVEHALHNPILEGGQCARHPGTTSSAILGMRKAGGRRRAPGGQRRAAADLRRQPLRRVRVPLGRLGRALPRGLAALVVAGPLRKPHRQNVLAPHDLGCPQVRLRRERMIVLVLHLWRDCEGLEEVLGGLRRDAHELAPFVHCAFLQTHLLGLLDEAEAPARVDGGAGILCVVGVDHELGRCRRGHARDEEDVLDGPLREHEQFPHREVPVLHRPMERRLPAEAVAALIRGPQVGLAFHEQVCDLPSALLGGDVQNARALPVLGVHVRLGLDEDLHRLHPLEKGALM
mmetsp:Transcript_47381/g.138121  ORF Transcript_47381/g.138121 Transcript_47381/m.138121 type:complete len:416 (+) Transcript_47381:1978-3225(+)